MSRFKTHTQHRTHFKPKSIKMLWHMNVSLPCQEPKREHPIDSQFDWPIEEFLNKVKQKGVSTPPFTLQDSTLPFV